MRSKKYCGIFINFRYTHNIKLHLHLLKYLNMNNGTVKFFNNSKGFGFIVPDDGEKDVFVHANGLIDEIKEGDKVTFEIEESPKGLNALNVRVVSK